MDKNLPDSANLEHLKGQAKSLLRSLRAHEPEALVRVAGLPFQEPFRLANAQLAVAREYGFDSWSKLKKHVEGYPDRRTAFFAAIRAGDRDAVRSLLEQDRTLKDAHDPDSFGAAPIVTAANRGDQGLIDLLLDHGVDIDGRSDWWAGSFGALDGANEEMSAYLLKRGATLTAHAAARLGMVKELKEMIRRDPQVVHQRGGDGQFPLHFSKTPEIVDILLDAGSDIDARDIDHNSTAAMWRIQEHNVLRRLLERGATPDVYMGIVLGDLALVKRLVEEDPDVLNHRITDREKAPGGNIYIYTIGDLRPDQLATHVGNDEIYRYFFEKADAKGKLLASCWRPEPEVARKIAAENPGLVASLALPDMRVMAHAAWLHRTESVKLMAELGFDLDVQTDQDKMSPLACAGFHGYVDIIEALLPYKPSLTIKNAYGGTPLGTCIYGSMHGWSKDGDYPRSVEFLLEAGSPPPKELYGSPEVQVVLRRFGVT